ncbi:MAG: hypothetical protein PHS93_09770 [Candidatus Omnitrophica bacterium]|nr:hypothetical protein [Candidatus Omnitrophota bacterium]
MEEFKKWVKEGGNRSVDITIGKSSNPDYIKIWVYDYDLSVGQHVNSADEINLDLVEEQKDRKEYERLKEKFKLQEIEK